MSEPTRPPAQGPGGPPGWPVGVGLLVTIGGAFLVARGVLGLLAAAGWHISSVLDTFVVVLVFGVGTDYTIFLISRFREELARDAWPIAARRAVGRIAAIVNDRHVAKHGEKTGFFGLFECENDRTVAAVVGEALVLLLDGIPCVDVEAATPTRFAEKMELWKRCIYPSLARSEVRYFHAVKESNKVECISIIEVTFPKIK